MAGEKPEAAVQDGNGAEVIATTEDDHGFAHPGSKRKAPTTLSNLIHEAEAARGTVDAVDGSKLIEKITVNRTKETIDGTDIEDRTVVSFIAGRGKLKTDLADQLAAAFKSASSSRIKKLDGRAGTFISPSSVCKAILKDEFSDPNLEIKEEHWIRTARMIANHVLDSNGVVADVVKKEQCIDAIQDVLKVDIFREPSSRLAIDCLQRLEWRVDLDFFYVIGLPKEFRVDRHKVSARLQGLTSSTNTSTGTREFETTDSATSTADVDGPPPKGTSVVKYKPNLFNKKRLDNLDMTADDFTKYRKFDFVVPTIKGKRTYSVKRPAIVSKFYSIISEDMLLDFDPVSDQLKMDVMKALPLEVCRVLPRPLRNMLHQRLASSGDAILCDVEAYRAGLVTLGRAELEEHTWEETVLLPAVTVFSDHTIHGQLEDAFTAVQGLNDDSAKIMGLALTRIQNSWEDIGKQMTDLKVSAIRSQHELNVAKDVLQRLRMSDDDTVRNLVSNVEKDSERAGALIIEPLPAASLQLKDDQDVDFVFEENEAFTILIRRDLVRLLDALQGGFQRATLEFDEENSRVMKAINGLSLMWHLAKLLPKPLTHSAQEMLRAVLDIFGIRTPDAEVYKLLDDNSIWTSPVIQALHENSTEHMRAIFAQTQDVFKKNAHSEGKDKNALTTEQQHAMAQLAALTSLDVPEQASLVFTNIADKTMNLFTKDQQDKITDEATTLRAELADIFVGSFQSREPTSSSPPQNPATEDARSREQVLEQENADLRARVQVLNNLNERMKMKGKMAAKDVKAQAERLDMELSAVTTPSRIHENGLSGPNGEIRSNNLESLATPERQLNAELPGQIASQVGTKRGRDEFDPNGGSQDVGAFGDAMTKPVGKKSRAL